MNAQPMVAAKTERLLNLVIALLYTRRPLTRAQIRTAVAAYADTGSDEAFERMFERDKDELRELGIPLLTVQLDTLFEDEPAYTIDRREYALPEVRFAPDEMAVLGLASRAWAHASLAGPAAEALRKLAADGVERDSSSLIGIETWLRTSEPAFDAVTAAVIDRRPITFTYRTAASGEVRARHVQPWGLINRTGRWYLTGFDTDRGAPRVFRLDRIDGAVRSDGRPGSYDVPEDHEPRALVAARSPEEPVRTARLWVREGAGHALRRTARPVDTGESPGPPPGWEALDVPLQHVLGLADEVASFGPDVLAIAPAELRETVVARLRGAAAAHRPGGVPPATRTESDAEPNEPSGSSTDRRARTRRESTGRSRRPRASQESATARLSRLLTMVPWLLNRQGIDIEEAAAELAVSRAQLESDLALLFLCGTPGGMPDDLIDADWEEGRIYLGNAEAISRPLRLGRDEALALMVGLRTLAAIPGLTERDALDRTLAKLEAAASADAAASVDAARRRIQVDMGSDAREATLAALRDALARRRRVHLRYLVPARDEATERDVDPMRLTSVDGRWYLEGWCHRSADVRLFRLDRMERVDVLEVPGEPPPQARPRNLDEGVFQARPDDLTVTLELAESASWVADYYPHVRYDPPLLTLQTADTSWLRRLLWRLGGSALARQPAWLAEEVAAGADAALDAYAAWPPDEHCGPAPGETGSAPGGSQAPHVD